MATPITAKQPMITTSGGSTGAATKVVCFSFAAYAKSLLHHLESLNLPVLPGLTDPEFTSIESALNFTFPPDLRSILQEGLPLGPHFPNWRSSSLQQLQILLILPSLNLSKNISQNNFWVDSWGRKPEDIDKALDIAKGLLDKASVLVPVYRNCYVPCTPNVPGNPVFYVDDEQVRILSFDLTRFFQQVDFLQTGFHSIKPLSLPIKENACINIVPAWAANYARKIGFWTEVVERGRRAAARGETRRWWDTVGRDLELRDCLEEVFWRLINGGWREEEVREMMEGGSDQNGGCVATKFDKEDVFCHGRMGSIVFSEGRWRKEEPDDLEDDYVSKDICLVYRVHDIF